jgi:hypothetical protein
MTSATDNTPNAAPSQAVQVADGVTIALAMVAVWMALVARPVSLFMALGDVLSPSSLIYIAGCVQVVRHLIWPTPSAISRLRDLRVTIDARPHVAAALRGFVMTRPAVFVVAVAAVITIGVTTSGFVLSRDPVANLPARFDAGWYADIALDGYTWDHTFQRQRNIAFFPALPLLMRPVGAVLGMYEEGPSRERKMLRGLWGGVVISLAAFLWALYYVSRLADDLIGPERAPAAVLLLAAYPFAIYFNAPYTESLFLLGTAGACAHFLRRDWVSASLWGLLAGLSRPNGCFLCVPLAILAVQGRDPRFPYNGSRIPAGIDDAQSRESVRRVAGKLMVAAMPGVGMMLFTLYLYQLTGGVWFAWARSHEAWGRSFQGFAPVVSLAQRFGGQSVLQLVTENPYNAINAAGVLFAVLMLYPVFRTLGLAWGMFVVVNLLPPLAAGGLLSMGRLTSTLFPLFLALAALVPARTIPGWTAAFGIAQGLCATLFFTWRSLF